MREKAKVLLFRVVPWMVGFVFILYVGSLMDSAPEGLVDFFRWFFTGGPLA